jgi:hypothetical protein
MSGALSGLITRALTVISITVLDREMGRMSRWPEGQSDQERPMSQEQKSSRRDHLTLTTEEGKIELMEEQLSRVVGGRAEPVDGKHKAE